MKEDLPAIVAPFGKAAGAKKYHHHAVRDCRS